MYGEDKGPSFFVCLLVGLFVAAMWAAPVSVLRLVIFTENQYHTAFIAILGWCIALNGVTLLTNLLDKSLACSDCGRCRVPEVVLHFFTLLGGGAATVLSMIFFCHKFNKGSYKHVFVRLACFSFLFIGVAYALAYGLDCRTTTTVNPSTTASSTNTTTVDFLASSSTSRLNSTAHNVHDLLQQIQRLTRRLDSHKNF